MRKVLMVLLVAASLGPAFAGRNESAAEERVYCYDESAIKPNAYFDLSQTLYLPRYGTNWGADGSNPDYGTYGDKNYIGQFGCALLVCMDELTPAELQHMSDANDYVAMVTVSWRCIDPACETPEKYNGSYTFVLHGHFNDSDPVNRQISMYVNPTADSMKLDLATILAAETEEGRQRKIADLNLYCSSRNDNWKDRLFLFLSSNPNYNATGSTFRLVGETNRNKSIPFKILVKNSDGSGNRVFEGDGTYTKRKSDCIEIPDSCIQVLMDRLTALHYSVLFESDVYISFESGIDIDALPSDIYESYIYYHIVYADSNLVN